MLVATRGLASAPSSYIGVYEPALVYFYIYASVQEGATYAKVVLYKVTYFLKDQDGSFPHVLGTRRMSDHCS
eukprot:8121086-Heterocapsa_arctica.AAC.1